MNKNTEDKIVAVIIKDTMGHIDSYDMANRIVKNVNEKLAAKDFLRGLSDRISEQVMVELNKQVDSQELSKKIATSVKTILDKVFTLVAAQLARTGDLY